ncbi:VOC family protein [Actinomadura parmotrematis]|uniref:VOC family protein n=1 Tax=Actinomadura parmotrematis TaxID=2864039 RepID=A0ABS7FP67_9ACTN|nr:VOC family protein [Actinomadura parmotrematis]MBW8482096.1 VOC family protein [Actinomadura parmotrematis]
MDYKLELVVVPVTDVTASRDFYAGRAGFAVDVDIREPLRLVQLTPPGSACSITLLEQPDRAGTLQGVHLVVTDAEAARADLAGRGVDVTGPYHYAGGGQTDGASPGRGDYETFLSFTDPDGNGWLVQEVGHTG